MRVTNALFYTNAANNYQRNMQELFKVNTQISSGMKIQNSFEDNSIYVDTMRLNYEIATLEQVKESSSKAQTYTNNTDSILNQFIDSLDRFKTKMIQASSEINSTTSLEALANELSFLREHMISLGNTSINGQFIFSGTSFTIKPIDADGNYRGNDGTMEALIGAGVKLPYNVSGQDLFLGQNSDYHRVLSTNVKMLNQIELHPSGNGLPVEVYLNENNTIRDMVGDSDSDSSNDPNTIFYLSGRKSDGETFSKQLELSSSSKISDLLEKIGHEYGNTSTNKVVDVVINDHGQIEIKDLNSGRAFLEMHIFGAIDRDATAGTAGNASQADIDDLLSLPNIDIIEFNNSNFKTSITATTISSREDIHAQGLFRVGYPMSLQDGSFVDEATQLSAFMPSSVNHINVNGTDVLASSTVQDLLAEIVNQYGGTARLENGQIIVENPTTTPMVLIAENTAGAAVSGFALLDAMNYERRGFEKDGNTLNSNISQMVLDTNSFATNSTKLSEVSEVSLSGKQFIINGINSSGSAFNAQIDFASPSTTFSLDGGTTNYTIFDATGGQTAYNEITYRQLSDVVSMITSNNIPASINAFSDYKSALVSSKNSVEVGLDYQGRLQIHDKLNSKSSIEFFMFDANADNSTVASTISFMANDSVKIADPNIDFYKNLDEMIEAVRSGTFRMDEKSDNPRNIGMQNSLNRLDQLMDHFTKEQTKIGSYSNALSQANVRSQLLSINIQTIRSEVIDTDIGEAYMRFNQLSTSYQAMLSTVAKINSMSLLNYM